MSQEKTEQPTLELQQVPDLDSDATYISKDDPEPVRKIEVYIIFQLFDL